MNIWSSLKHVYICFVWVPPSCCSRSWCRRTNKSLCRAGIASHTSTSPHMATHSRTAHTYSHAVCTHLQCARNGCCAFACFYLSNITKAHYHCDTLVKSVTQTECQTRQPWQVTWTVSTALWSQPAAWTERIRLEQCGNAGSWVRN